MSNLKKGDLTTIENRFVELTDKKTFELEASFALQIVNKSQQLQKVDKSSLISAILNVANFGLTLNPVKKEAYLVPRWDKMLGNTAYLEPSYMGLIKAVTELGGIISIEAHAVYIGDDFDFEYGLEPKLKHRPKRNSKELQAVYAIATLDGGQKQFEVMSAEEIYEVRETSTSYRAMKEGKISTCIWRDWEGEMARKTVIRRLIKYLPKRNNDRLMNLVAEDETDYAPSFSEYSYAESLLQSSTYDHEQLARIEANLHDMNKPELEALVLDLQRNQKPASEITNPSQAQRIEAIKDKE